MDYTGMRHGHPFKLLFGYNIPWSYFKLQLIVWYELLSEVLTGNWTKYFEAIFRQLKIRQRVYLMNVVR